METLRQHFMLTAKQQQILEFIRSYTVRNGLSPTQQEIADEFNIRHRGTVSKHLSALRDKGYLNKSANGWRAIELTETANDSGKPFSLPMAGKIAAGSPIEAIQGRDEIDLYDYLLGPDRFLLTIEGDSMTDAGILDGDIVIIQQQNTANNGEIVVALIDKQEATLKYFFRRDAGKVELMPDNSKYEPMMYDGGRVQIQGVLVAQLRRY